MPIVRLGFLVIFVYQVYILLVKQLKYRQRDDGSLGGYFPNAMTPYLILGSATLFLVSLMGFVWYFSLWSYLDRLLILAILYGLAKDALQLMFGPLTRNPLKKVHLRASNGDSIWIEKYLQRGGDPNLRAENSMTPLYLAASQGHLEIVKLLVERGADLNLKVQDLYPFGFPAIDFTPLLISVCQGHDDIVEFLLENEAEKKIEFSALSGDLEAIIAYVESGEDLLLPREIDSDELYLIGQTLLHLAAWNDSSEVIEYLLEKGCEIDGLDLNHYTPLHMAAARDSISVARLLIDRGATVDAKSKSHDTPLHCAASCGHVEMIQLLLDSGADVNALAELGFENALHKAIAGNHVEAVKLLVDRGANINFRAGFGITPLRKARQLGGRKEIIRVLRDCGAKMHEKSEMRVK